MRHATHRKFIPAAAFALFLGACSSSSFQEVKTTSVLFVGNSLTYVGNLPAVFTALCDAAELRCSAEMIVEGGATLGQRVDDQTLSPATRSLHFDYLVLQERGGDYIALPSRVADKRQAENAIGTLVQQARQSEMKPILLGTYQSDPRASTALVEAESTLAASLNIPHIAVSNLFVCGRREHASLRWLDADGGHPGPDLTMLMAVLLYREVFGNDPPVQPVSIHAPIYGPMNSPRATAFASTQSISQEILRTVAYDAATMKAVEDLSQDECE